MLTLTAGCAVQPPRPAAWRLEPTVSVTHSQASSTAYYQMGHYEAGLQRWDRAADAYRKAIAADPRNVEAYNALGVVLAQAKRYGEARSEEHTSELQSRVDLVCRLLLEKKKKKKNRKKQ